MYQSSFIIETHVILLPNLSINLLIKLFCCPWHLSCLPSVQISLLDAKKSMNVNIFLKQFRKSTDVIIQLIRDGDPRAFGVEKLKSLFKLLPSSDEVMIMSVWTIDYHFFVCLYFFFVNSIMKYLQYCFLVVSRTEVMNCNFCILLVFLWHALHSCLYIDALVLEI